MAVTFKSDDWIFALSKIEEQLKNHRAKLEQPNTTEKERDISVGAILALKTLQNLPQTNLPQKGK